jgi:HTH-type transcriptional regulator/antitoxin HipB
MNYPVNTSLQLRGVLRGLRRSRRLTQAQVGELLGVSQKRIAQIENAPEVTSFDQIAQLVAALGGRLAIETAEPKTTNATNKPQKRSPKTRTSQADW